MNIYHHSKTNLATAVCRNKSKFTNQLIWIGVLPIKSIPSMKFPDTTTISVCAHHEMPSGFTPIALFHKGKRKTII